MRALRSSTWVSASLSDVPDLFQIPESQGRDPWSQKVKLVGTAVPCLPVQAQKRIA